MPEEQEPFVAEDGKARLSTSTTLYPAGTSWAGGGRPIATAPKDGTIIDLWYDGDRVADARWGKYRRATKDSPGQVLEFEGWVYWHGQYSGCDIDHYHPEKITHWMPLPLPPPPEGKA
jgi:hypothetical protein